MGNFQKTSINVNLDGGVDFVLLLRLSYIDYFLKSMLIAAIYL